jgi:DNA-binding response OmpR family regulator
VSERIRSPNMRTHAESMAPRVLIVEDEADIRSLLAAALRRAGLEVDAAEDGRQGLQMCEAFEYAMIILDLMMPVLDGFEFLDAFGKATPKPRSVILVVTAFDDRMIDRLTGVHGVVKKPFDLERFVAIVRDTVASWSANIQSAHADAAPLPVVTAALQTARPC